jgi:hypothetical protein
MCDSATRPAFIPATNVAKVTMKYQLNLNEVENVFHFLHDGTILRSDLINLTNEVEGQWLANIAPHQPTDLKLVVIEAVDLSAPSSLFDSRRVDTFGSVAAASLPGNVTLSIKFDGGFVGRSKRGRMYWLQLVEPYVVGDLVQTTPLGEILGGVEAFFEGIHDALPGWSHVIVSYCQDGSWLSEGETTLIDNYSSDGIVDRQRRRLTGRGR